MFGHTGVAGSGNGGCELNLLTGGYGKVSDVATLGGQGGLLRME